MRITKDKVIKWTPVAFILLFAFAYALYAARVSYNVPHMDAWKGLADIIEKYMAGDITFHDWFPIPHAEYFSLLSVPMQYILYNVLHMNFQVLTYAGIFFIAMESIVIWKAYQRSIQSKSEGEKRAYYIAFPLVLLAVYNLNQWEIASFYCAVEFFLRICFYCYMFSYIDKLLHKEKNRYRDYVYAGILCVVAIIVISHAYFPGAIATVAFTMLYDYFSKRNWKNIKYYLVTASFVIAAGVLYIATYAFSQLSGSTASEARGLLQKLLVLGKAFVLMSGSPLFHQSTATSLTPYYILGASNILVSILCVFYYFRNKEHKNSYMPLMLMLYGYVSIAIIAYVRLSGFELGYVVSSRYVVETTLILIGNIWILISMVISAAERCKGHKVNFVKVFSATAALLILVGCIAKSDLTEWKIAPYRKDSFKQMAYNILNIDYVSDAELAIAQAPAQDVRDAVVVMEKYGLGVFYDLPRSEELQRMMIDYILNGEYKVHSGVYGDNWAAPNSSYYVKTGEDTALVLEGKYPFEITGNEKMTITVGEEITEYYISEENISVSILVPANSIVEIKIACDFYRVNLPDVRQLAFIFQGFTGYLARK